MKTTISFLLSLLLITGGKDDLFSTKNLESRMIKVEEGLYANKYETTNAEYREFLEWAKVNRSDILETLKVNHQGWDDFLGAEYSPQYFSNKGLANNPVVNISHDAALEFCEWLTQQYNDDTSKRKKFAKVKFRLPTEEEWLNMAYNGRKVIVFPWGTPYMRDRDGNFMAQFRRYANANIKSPVYNPKEVEIVRKEESRSDMLSAGAIITAPVTGYKPTGAGFYHLSGNAAEMLAEKGRTKGGSWASSGYYLRIDAEDQFEGFTTSPFVGFRYVMEVIEE